MSGTNLNKVLKLSNNNGNIDIFLIKDVYEIKIKNQDVKNIIDNILEDVRLAYLKLPKLLHFEKKGKFFKVKIKNSKGILVNISSDNISNELGKLIDRKGFEVDINGEKVFFEYKKDFLSSSINYIVAKDIVKNIKEAKTIVIKNMPYLSRVKTDKKTPYEKAFNRVIKLFSLEEEKQSKKYVNVEIIFEPFKNLQLKFKTKMKLNKRDFAEKNSYLNILKRIKNGEYKVKYIGFGYKEKEGSYLLISYTFIPETDLKNKYKVMGIDLGQISLVYFAILDTQIRGDISGVHLWEKRILSVWKRKRFLQKELMEVKNYIKNYGEDDSIKKEKDRIAKELKNLRKYEKNFMETLNKQIASKLIKIAKKENVGTIVLEDITISPEEKNALKFPKWNYGQLQEFIKSKALENNIHIKKINPSYTSQRCPNCGFIGFIKDMVRPKRDDFICPKCGFKGYADYVAALNIATENIEEKIRNKLIEDIELLKGRKLNVKEKSKNVRILQSWRIKLLKYLIGKLLNINTEKKSLKKLLNRLEAKNKEMYILLIRDLKEFKIRAQAS